MKARSTTACWSVASRRRRWPGEAGEEGAVVVARVREMEGDHGFNAQTGIYENLVEAGVIDPTKVVRSARQNAASIASLLLSTEAVICESPGAKDAGPTSGGMPLVGGDVLTPGGRGGATRSGDRAAAGAGER